MEKPIFELIILSFWRKPSPGISLESMRMMLSRYGRSAGWLAGFAILLWAPANAKEPSTALEMARQLNQAFIEVADQVSPAVVVIRVAHKASYSELDPDA